LFPPRQRHQLCSSGFLILFSPTTSGLCTRLFSPHQLQRSLTDAPALFTGRCVRLFVFNTSSRLLIEDLMRIPYPMFFPSSSTMQVGIFTKRYQSPLVCSYTSVSSYVLPVALYHSRQTSGSESKRFSHFHLTVPWYHEYFLLHPIN
jgi:hypothetical protein